MDTSNTWIRKDLKMSSNRAGDIKTEFYQSLEDVHHTNVSKLGGNRRDVVRCFRVYVGEHHDLRKIVLFF
jgi:hypothetical protein